MFLHPCTLIIVTINSGKYNQTPRVAPLRAVHTDCDGHVLRSQCLRSRHWSLGAACTRASDGRARWRQRRPAQGRGVHLPGSAARCAAVARRAVRGQEGTCRQRERPGELPPAGSWRGATRATVMSVSLEMSDDLSSEREVFTQMLPTPPVSSPRLARRARCVPPAPTLSLSVTTSKCFL